MKTIIILKLNIYLILGNIYAQYSEICNFGNAMLTNDIICGDGHYYLVYEDNFNNPTLDTRYWEVINGVIRDPYHNGEQQWYSSNNIVLSDGILKLESRQESLIDQCFSIWTGSQMETFCQDFQYTSAEIDSKYKFGYGVYEIRCKIPKGKGFWPAFWLYTGTPVYDEIDVFEFWNDYTLGNFDLEKSVRNHHMNYQNDWGEEHHDCPFGLIGEDYSADFHTYQLKWTPTEISFYIDDVLVRKNFKFLTSLSQPIECENLEVLQPYLLNKSFPNYPMQMISNLAIQSQSESPDFNAFLTNSLEIDYIKYYKQFGECRNEVNILNTPELNLNNVVYNVILGENIFFGNNVVIGPLDQLTVISTNELVISSNTVIDFGSNFQTEQRDNLCSNFKFSSLNNEVNELKIFKNNELEVESLAQLDSNYIHPYPNPFVDKIVIKNYANKLIVKNLQNKIVFEQILPAKNELFEIDLSSLKSGSYLLYYITNSVIVFDSQIIKL